MKARLADPQPYFPARKGGHRPHGYLLPGQPMGSLYFRHSHMNDLSPDTTEQTMAFWYARTGLACSVDAAQQMVADVAGFFALLAQWDDKNQEEHRQRDNTRRRTNVQT
jgi:hypothetical protein